MAVFRIERTRDYTVMSNHHLRNGKLSLKAKGLLSMMLSLPEDWNYTTRGLAAICKEGVDAIGGALRELETAGYIVRYQLRDRQGRISDTEYVIYEQPQPKKQYISRGIITDVPAKRIAGYKFKDWARLSKNLLCLNGCDKHTGEIISLIRAMWEYNLNFMELINSEEFTFRDELEGRKRVLEKSLHEFQFEDLKDYYYSAPVKRMIWQTVLALQEITQIMRHNPKRIFIEMTRTEEEKGEPGRKASREKRLLKLYENIRESRDWTSEIKNAGASGSLNSKKLYLYYLQMGKDAYTGEEIDIEELFTDNRYDIDHIYPRSLTNDNNIDNNLVLVSKKINQDEKKNDYPLPEKVRSNPKVWELWSSLHKRGFMNDEKYNRLTASTPLTDEQLAGFIARQLVETAQGTKGIADLFKAKKMGFSFFEKEQKYEMISLLKEEVIIGNRNEYLTNAIKIYTKSVFDALNDNDVSQIKFYRTNEL